MSQINLLMYLVALKSSLEDTNSLIHQTHPAVHQTHCVNKAFRQAEPGGTEVGSDQLGHMPPTPLSYDDNGDFPALFNFNSFSLVFTKH